VLRAQARHGTSERILRQTLRSLAQRIRLLDKEIRANERPTLLGEPGVGSHQRCTPHRRLVSPRPAPIRSQFAARTRCVTVLARVLRDQPWVLKYQAADVTQVATSTVKVRPPNTGRTHPAMPRLVSTSILTVNTPKKRHPRRECSSTRVS
jgi:hypothetical protein